jgi:hypothetical protein
MKGNQEFGLFTYNRFMTNSAFILRNFLEYVMEKTFNMVIAPSLVMFLLIQHGPLLLIS